MQYIIYEIETYLSMFLTSKEIFDEIYKNEAEQYHKKFLADKVIELAKGFTKKKTYALARYFEVEDLIDFKTLEYITTNKNEDEVKALNLFDDFKYEYNSANETSSNIFKVEIASSAEEEFKNSINDEDLTDEILEILNELISKELDLDYEIEV